MTTTTPNTTTSKAHARAIVRATLATRAAQAELDKAQQELTAAETAARAEGFISASVLYRGIRYTVNTGTTFKLETFASDVELVAFASNNGLKIQAPKPASCSASTLRAAYARGLDVSSVANVTETSVYTVLTGSSR